MKSIIISFKSQLYALFILFVSFVSPITGLFYIVGLAVALDTFFAVYASIKLSGLKSFQSHKLFNIVIKTLFYMGTILVAYLCSKHITEGSLFGISFFLPKFICGFWLFIELKSIDETSVKLGNKPFYEVVKSIINKVKEFKKDFNEIKSDE